MLIPIAAVVLFAVPQTPVPAVVQVEHRGNAEARPGFRLTTTPVPARSDAAATATFTLVDGRVDRNSPGLDVLHDGRLPSGSDQPAANFFFAGDGGRFAIDLGSAQKVARVDSYSWHPGPRGPQLYTLYVADGAAAGFDAAPRRGTDPLQCGWQLLAKVDTRTDDARGAGGQYAVDVQLGDGPQATLRYLLFDVAPTNERDRSSNTFFSEIDVRLAAPAAPAPIVGKTADGRYTISIDATATPDLQAWADDELMPVLLDWYPRIVAMLPSDGFEAPAALTVRFDDEGRGVAATSGTRVVCAAPWFRDNLRGEAIGAVVHELVHVAQRYGGRGRNRGQRPGWAVEGIADYIRWFLYEPQSHGADIADPATARSDASYRISANFLAWAVRTHDRELVTKLNAALRGGTYDEALWQQLCGKPRAELEADWRSSLVPPPGLDVLTDEEKAAGWKLLFNGVDLRGWHSFHHDGVRPGWQVVEGAIVCADPHDAGDLCTDARYGEFELVLDYKMSPGGNSGVMFHVSDEGSAAWATGPECQLLDNKDGKDPNKAGWLYALYKTEVDATKPAGEWNHLRLLITKQRCEHEMNGVKYFDYVMHSEDFDQRLAASKFASMPGFARFDEGYLALQGDHGLVSFRNLKIRPISSK
ncbi:MAG: DUF1080 domain-containing protein [Planctomycetes bacterium]|nr:DUF1080 domain-containing protein [Planctomycetota bacterium]